MTDHGKMEPEYTIQGYKSNRVFFAEKNMDRSDIFMIKLAISVPKAKKCKIYELSARMIAIENDNSNKMIQKEKNTIFVLGDDMKIRHLQETLKVSEIFNCIGVYDFTGYDLSTISINKWS